MFAIMIFKKVIETRCFVIGVSSFSEFTKLRVDCVYVISDMFVPLLLSWNMSGIMYVTI